MLRELGPHPLARHLGGDKPVVLRDALSEHLDALAVDPDDLTAPMSNSMDTGYSSSPSVAYGLR